MGLRNIVSTHTLRALLDVRVIAKPGGMGIHRKQRTGGAEDKRMKRTIHTTSKNGDEEVRSVE